MTISAAHLRSLLQVASMRPWRTYSGGICSERDGEGLAATERNQDADLICAAVNSLEPLLAVFEAACAWDDINNTAAERYDLEHRLRAAVRRARRGSHE